MGGNVPTHARGVDSPPAAPSPWAPASAFDDRRPPRTIHTSRTTSWWRPWWTPVHERLARHPTFAPCSRAEIRRIVRWGDEVEVAATEVLVRQGKIGYWFFAIHSGEVELRRDEGTATVLGPGDHFGEVAILGSGPQPMTAAARSRGRLFILGRQYFIGVLDLVPAMQQSLYPDVPPSEWEAHVRRLRMEGSAAWRRLAPRTRPRGRRSISTHPTLLPGRRSPGSPHSFPRLADRGLPRRVTPPTQATPLPGRVVAGLVGLPIAVLLCAVLFLWHPPIAVISPGHPVDISHDLTVAGAPTHPINGAYVITPVIIRQPTLSGLMRSWIRGDTTRPIKPSRGEHDDVRRADREAFTTGRLQAVAATAELLELDAAGLDVGFTPRRFSGSSASLIYAIALADILSPHDIARGRTIAATGELAEDGTVIAVRHVAEKAHAAQRQRATLFLVPRGQHPRGAGVEIHEVASLADALRFLAQP